MSEHALGSLITRRFHIVSITLRRAPGDRAYHVRQSFDANLEGACKRHEAFALERLYGVRCSVLRDGETGVRYSLEQSHEVASSAEFEAKHFASLAAIAKARSAS